MIKNLIYLDEQKMYSLSSQIFEGITEYIVSEESNNKEESETQKGPIRSGKILADLIRVESKSSEKKYLHDYSYSVFERHLIENKNVLEITPSNLEQATEVLGKYSFVKIKSKAIFNDIKQLVNLIDNFNELGKAITYVTTHKQVEEATAMFKEAQKTIKDRNKKSQAKQTFDRLTNMSKLSKESGLQQDKDLLKYLSLLLNYGFHDQIEIQQKINDLLFSANLKRECLRESEELLIKKYSRKTEKEIVIFGIATQVSGESDFNINQTEEFETLKEALMLLLELLTNIELSFSGKLSYEVVIDPIAVYCEV